MRAAVLALLLAACGGGGGDYVVPVKDTCVVLVKPGGGEGQCPQPGS